MEICRRCKREFTQERQEARCKPCLAKRRANRITKRKAARIEEAEFARVGLVVKSHDRMMRLNGSKGARKVRLFH